MTRCSHRLVLAALALAIAGCGGRAPKTGESLDAAERAVTRAEQNRVADYAAVDLRNAREKLAAARDAARQSETNKDGKLAVQAAWLAEEARVDADLASTRAQLSKTQAVLLQKQRALDEAAPPAPALPPANPPGGQP